MNSKARKRGNRKRGKEGRGGKEKWRIRNEEWRGTKYGERGRWTSKTEKERMWRDEEKDVGDRMNGRTLRV